MQGIPMKITYLTPYKGMGTQMRLAHDAIILVAKYYYFKLQLCDVTSTIA